MRSSRRQLGAKVVAPLATLALIAAACGSSDEESTPTTLATPESSVAPRSSVDNESSAPEASGDPIVIGAAIGETGFMRVYDWEAYQTAKLAVDDLNANGGLLGRPVELIHADTTSDPAVSATAALKVIEQGAEILIASCDFDFGASQALAAQDKGIITISLCASAPNFGPAGIGPLAFSAGIGTPNEAAALAQFAYEDKGWRVAYELEDTTLEYTRTYHEAFRAAWEQLGGTFAGRDSFANGDASFSTQINSITSLESEPDFIVSATFPPGGAAMVRQVRAAGIDLPILSCAGMDGTYWLDAVPDLGNFYHTAFGSHLGDDEIPLVNELRDRFETATGEGPTTSYFVNGYQTIDLIRLAVEKAGVTDGEKVAAALQPFDEEVAPLGRTTFDDKYHVSLNRPEAIIGVENGDPYFVSRVAPDFVPEPES